MIMCDKLTKAFITSEIRSVKNQYSNILTHTFNETLKLNTYAATSLLRNNDSKKKSPDEAYSIHIITSALKTNIKITYETDIQAFYGKPDFIIRLGKNLFIMVSTTRAICKENKNTNIIFDENAADRLVIKKITGLNICSRNLECLVDDNLQLFNNVIAILHILAPNKNNADMCLNSLKKISLNNIKSIIVIIDFNLLLQ